MQEHAEVIRLETQLTVPSRHNTQLSDVWFAISCGTPLCAWGKALASVENSLYSRRLGARAVQLVHMSEQRGWIVARGVDLGACSLSDVEARLRRLVDHANETIVAAQAAQRATDSGNGAASPSAGVNWSRRIRSGIRAAGHVALTALRRPAELNTSIRS